MTHEELTEALARFDGEAHLRGHFGESVARRREQMLTPTTKGKDMATRLGPPQAPREEYGGKVEEQIALARKALQTDRFNQSKPTAELDARFAETSRGAGVGK
jgi:hypothetical protein